MNKIIKNHWNPILIIISSVVISFLYLNNILIKNFLDNILLAKFKTDSFKMMLIFLSMIIIGIFIKFIELGIRFTLMEKINVSLDKSTKLYCDNSGYIEIINNTKYFKLKTIQNNNTGSNQNIPDYFYIKSGTNLVYIKNQDGSMTLCNKYVPIFHKIEMSNATMKRNDSIVFNEAVLSQILKYDGLKASEDLSTYINYNIEQPIKNLHDIDKSEFPGRWFIYNVLYDRFFDKYLIDGKFYSNDLWRSQFVGTTIVIKSPNNAIEAQWCGKEIYGKEIKDLYYFDDDGTKYRGYYSYDDKTQNKSHFMAKMKPTTISSCLKNAIQSTFNPFIEKRK